MEFFKVTPVADAIEILKQSFDISFKTKKVALTKAKGKISAFDIYSRINIPSFDKSIVDGYALRSQDTLGASDSIPAMLTFAGSVSMGNVPDFSISAGEAAYIPTGGALPQGADAVIMIEHTDKVSDLVCVYKPLAYNENVAKIGDDIGKGERLICKGSKLSAFDIGILAGAGQSYVEVLQPTAYIIATGDELQRGKKLEKAKIFDSNSEMLAGLLADMGVSEAGRVQIEDKPEELIAEIKKGNQLADFVIVTGGSSVGERDFTADCIIEAGGAILIKGLALKPGKPTIVASLQNKPIFGLSGNPVSAAVAFLLLAPAILSAGKQVSFFAKAGINFASTPGRLTFQPVTVKQGQAYPVLGKSGILSTLTMADGYLLIEEKIEGINKGEDVEVFLFNG